FYYTMNDQVSKSCSKNGSCGVSGMCPGQALFLSLLAGMSLSTVTGIEWLTPVVAVILGFVLITGIWRRLIPSLK
ncbi:MAG: hypothetical protein O7C75_09570, partial [Verrucomicrobia bacterium]|nr:hypothetical protein [Verrucomicrobiota bacterium]